MRRRPLELCFNLGTTPIRVELGFWLLLLIVGTVATGPSPDAPSESPALWIAATLIAVAIHEATHLVTARLLRNHAELTLHAFGGLVRFERPPRRRTSIAILLSGPLASFGFAALAFTVLSHLPLPPLLIAGIQRCGLFSLICGGVNLMPVLPFDAGQILMASLPRGSEKYAALTGALFASLAACAIAWRWSLSPNALPLILFFGLLAWQNWQATSFFFRAAKSEPPPEARLALGWDALGRGDRDQATRTGKSLLEQAQTPVLRNAARDLLAWTALAAGNKGEAQRQIDRSEPPNAARALTRAMVAEANGEMEAALPFAHQALGQEPCETSARLAVRLLARTGRPGEARALAQDFPWPRPRIRAFALAECAVALGVPEEGSLRLSEHLASLRASPDPAPEDPHTTGEFAYDAACLFARAGARVQALTWLEHAATLGLEDPARVLGDPDFSELREDPELLKLLEHISKEGWTPPPGFRLT